MDVSFGIGRRAQRPATIVSAQAMAVQRVGGRCIEPFRQCRSGKVCREY